MANDELHYKILKDLTESPDTNQRALADRLGVSLGRVNYCLKALVEKGLVKARNFRNNKHKLSYAYLLTPRGIEEKTKLTVRFLNYKLEERKRLEQEIADLRVEVGRIKHKDSEVG